MQKPEVQSVPLNMMLSLMEKTKPNNGRFYESILLTILWAWLMAWSYITAIMALCSLLFCYFNLW